MEEIISRMKKDLLNEKHKLYEFLEFANAPAWWKELLKDKELYIDIRKENILDVYYLGGRMAEIKYNTKDQKLEVKAHPKYLGFSDKTDKRYYKKHINKKGKLDYNPIYQDCLDWITNRKEELKANIKLNYSGEDDGENTSEKFIQGNLVINNRDKYIDTEFAHRLYDGKKKTVRIDLVKIENGCFVFEELKRIGDYRLRTTDGNPEILEQITNYRIFLKQNKDVLTSYYRTLYHIKKRLCLPVPPVEDIEKVSVNPEPELLIAMNYDKKTDKRFKRKKEIEKILSTIDITPNYV